MLERILFPTDGSPLSDRAVPAVEIIAAAQGSAVHLVQAISPPVWATMDEVGYASDAAISVELYEQLLEELERQAQQNLDRLAERLHSHVPPIESASRLFQGSPYAALLDCEEEINAQLVVMATHGRTGLARFFRGSVADCMVREGTAPVLLVRSFGREVIALHTALVPLDGSVLAEEALTMVETLADKPVKQVRLLTVVPDTASEEEAAAYLRRTAVGFEGTGLEVRTLTRVGAPGEAIAELAAPTDLVIMATHGRGGLNRLRHGSVAEQVLREAPVPILLVRSQGP